MEYKKIDLSEYEVSGEGANGLSYDCIADQNIMVKMYNEGYDMTSIITEHNVARKVFQLGIPSPEPGELVTDGKRLGIRFRRIVGKRSFARAFSQEPDRVPELSREFARWCKKFHSFECGSVDVPDVKQEFHHLLDCSKLFDEKEKNAIGRFIDAVPDCTTAVHGDMHYGNALTTLPEGAPLSQKHDVYFIDLGYFGYGCPLFDLGMTYNISNLADEEFLEHDFHFKRETGLVAWDNFVDEYFFGPDKLGEKWFGSGVTLSEVNEQMEFYALCKLLLVEYNVGFMPPGYVDFCHTTAGKLI